MRHMWHPSRFTITWILPKKILKVVWSFREEYILNNFETRIDPLNRKTSYSEQTRAYNVSTVKQKHHMQGIPEYFYLNV